MLLTRHSTPDGPRWALDGHTLNQNLADLLALPRNEMLKALTSSLGESLAGPLLAPIDETQEVWAAGVTYCRSRDEREAESTVADVYSRVYNADRPELFFKAIGRRVVGHGAPIRVRKDSDWNVPEPELTLVVNRHLEIVGYTAGNDVSSRSIEGENPLYLPQAKSYDGSCALGPGIVLATEDELRELEISLTVVREGSTVYAGDARISQMKRSLSELVGYLGRETSFPNGVLLMTGTGIVPGQDFTLLPGDSVSITVGELMLTNEVDGNA